MLQRLVRLCAALFHIPADVLDYIFSSGQLARPGETLLPFPAELVPIGARLVARGWMNNDFFPTNRDWILPYWAQRQFDPHDPAFIPYGLNLFTLNYTHRDWTMIGNLGRVREAIVDPRGLVTPWFDGWSLDVWLECGGELYAPSRLSAVDQSLHENLPVVVTAFQAGNLRVRLTAFAVEDQGEWVIQAVTVENPSAAAQHTRLYLALRPFNAEGVSLVKKIQFVALAAPTARERSSSQGQESDDSHAAVFLVDDALGAVVPKPDGIALSDYRSGDVALHLAELNDKTSARDETGLATGVAAYALELAAGESRTLTVRLPMEKVERDEDDPDRFAHLKGLVPADELRDETLALWQAKIAEGMRVRLPDDKLQAAFEANKAFLLLLHDGDTITPGPFTYHQFWFRDAAYLLNALDKLGYHAEAKQVVERMPRYMEKDGYLRATEGEWDSNGAALWASVEHARLSGDLEGVAKNYWPLLRMASWINSKRQQTKKKTRTGQRAAYYGLLPPGMSAEHLGPSDYFYWDDWWGLAGLREMARVADWIGQTRDAERLHANFESFCADVNASLAAAAERLGRPAMPAAPDRRLDYGMVANLAALYPLRLVAPKDPRIVDTLAALKEKAWFEDGYYNASHSALGTYLSLHAAECYLFQRDPEAWKIVQWVLNQASPTFTWAEGIHPRTRGGAMGDGHHGWAAADFVLAVRNMLLLEEEDRLVITPVLPEDWTIETSVIKVEEAPTYFGNVSFTIAFGERTGTLVLDGDWRAAPASIEWNLPFALRDAGGDIEGVEISGHNVRLPKQAKRVVVMW